MTTGSRVIGANNAFNTIYMNIYTHIYSIYVYTHKY